MIVCLLIIFIDKKNAKGGNDLLMLPIIKNEVEDFHGGPVVRNQPCQCGRQDFNT